MSKFAKLTVAAGAVAAVAALAVPAFSNEETTARIHQDIQQTLGVVPQFFGEFPETRLSAMWSAYKAIHVNADTALDAKTKRLIAIAVAAQANCEACIYFETSAAFANGASFKEVQEAVAVFAVERDWSEALSGADFQMVKRDTDALVSTGALGTASTN